MLKLFITALIISTSLSLSSCSTDSSQKTPTDSSKPQSNSTDSSKPPANSTDSSKLQKYSSPNGYEFLHPEGWKSLDSKEKSDKVDVAFRASDKRPGNLYVIVNKAPKNKTLPDWVGTPSEFGSRLVKSLNSANSKNKAVLVGAKSRDSGGKTYYIVEYTLTVPNNQERRNLATSAIGQNKLFTLTLSSPQKQWDNVKGQFEKIANSFTVK